MAIFGGKPAFSEKLHVGRPNIGDKKTILNSISDILDSRWLTNNGKYLQEFEERIRNYLGVKHCIAVCNGTQGLQLAIKAMNLMGEVILPSFTFVATAHALTWQGLTPVFCDIDPNTYDIDPDNIEKLITENSSAILGVHLWGRTCDTDKLDEIAKKHNLKLFFDAAHAFGCSRNNIMVGNFGEAEILSFHATKFVNTFEGGAVVTNNDELADKIRLMRNFGFAGYDNVTSIGTNAKMSEVSAAMGLCNFDSIEKFIAVNQSNYNIYKDELRNNNSLKVLEYNENEKNNYQYIVLELDEGKTKISRDQLLKFLWAENILARRYFYPSCHNLEPYKSDYQNYHGELSVTENIANKVITLPTGTSITRNHISKICNIIKLIVDNGARIKEKLNMTNSNLLF